MLSRLIAIVLGSLVAVILLLVSPATVSAAWDPFRGACENVGDASSVCRSPGSDDPIAGADGVIVRVTSILAVIAGAVSVIFVTWGGFKYITSGGDSSEVATAKNTIIAALIGLVLALLARPIVLFVISRV